MRRKTRIGDEGQGIITPAGQKEPSGRRDFKESGSVTTRSGTGARIGLTERGEDSAPFNFTTTGSLGRSRVRQTQKHIATEECHVIKAASTRHRSIWLSVGKGRDASGRRIDNAQFGKRILIL